MCFVRSSPHDPSFVIRLSPIFCSRTEWTAPVVCSAVLSGGTVDIILFSTTINTTHFRQCRACVGELGGMSSSLPAALGTEDWWPWAMTAGTLPAPIALIILMLVPDSPRYLLDNCYVEEARDALNFYQSPTIGSPASKTWKPNEPTWKKMRKSGPGD